MDGQRVGEAHPAFFTVITQLAPDELLFLNDVATHEQSVIMARSGETEYPIPSVRDAVLSELQLSSSTIANVQEMMFRYENLNQPEMFPVYLEHLQHLGLIEYSNTLSKIASELIATGYPRDGFRLFCIRLTHFGRLFLKACTTSGLSTERS
jgi:hypothetical protein